MKSSGKNRLEKFFSEMGLSPEKVQGISITTVGDFVASALGREERYVILQYYIDCGEKSLRTIGLELGFSEERAEKGAESLRRRALRKLRCLKQRERLFALARRAKEPEESREIFLRLLGIS